MDKQVIKFSDKDGLLIIHMDDGKETIYYPKHWGVPGKKSKKITFEFVRKP